MGEGDRVCGCVAQGKERHGRERGIQGEEASKQADKQASFCARSATSEPWRREITSFAAVSHAAMHHDGSRNIHTCLAWINFDFTGRNGCLGSGEDAAKPKSLELPFSRKAL